MRPRRTRTNDDSLLRVSDFEVARLVAKYSPHTDPGEEALRFLSPEQIQEAAIDGRVDQFALGVLAYLLLTGTRPFDADHLATLYFRICKEEPRPAKEASARLERRSKRGNSEGAGEIARATILQLPRLCQRFSSLGSGRSRRFRATNSAGSSCFRGSSTPAGAGHASCTGAAAASTAVWRTSVSTSGEEQKRDETGFGVRIWNPDRSGRVGEPLLETKCAGTGSGGRSCSLDLLTAAK